MAAAVTGDDSAPDLLDALVPGGSLDAAAAVEVYREGYLARLTEQLGETYAAVARVLGEDSFRGLAARFVRGHGSSSTNLSDYGRDFPAFLEGVATPWPFLADLARLELEMHDLFHAPADAGLDAAALARAAAGGDVCFELQPTLRLLRYDHAVLDVYRLRHEESPVIPDVGRSQRLALFKLDGEGRAKELDDGAFAALAAMQRGLGVAEALGEASEADASFGPAEASRLFEFIALAGLVVAARQQGEDD